MKCFEEVWFAVDPPKDVTKTYICLWDGAYHLLAYSNILRMWRVNDADGNSFSARAINGLTWLKPIEAPNSTKVVVIEPKEESK